MPGCERDRRLSTRARAVVECSHRPFDHSVFDTLLDGLMMQSERPYCKKRRVLMISQQYPRPFDPARRFRSRLRDQSQSHCMLISERQFNRPSPRRHRGTSGYAEHDRENHKWRHLVENFFCNIKAFRRIATRYEKTDECFGAMVNLVAIVLRTR
jgi:hypothetical protein